jgi:3'-phosphoadenosine 5'-phosphosulfate sulfotransferase (PAPS reductase)/FAD synthetase
VVGVYTNEDLKNMQSMSLEDKIQVTKTRIIEWYVKNEGKVYISFSGGKDSTVLLHISQQEFPNITKVYIDTGLEYPEVKQFALSQPNVIKIKPEISFRKVIEIYGYPLISKEVSRYIYTARNCPNGKVAQKFVPNNPHDLKYGMGYSMVKWADLKESDIPISHKCCDITKKNPAKKFEKETGLKPITAMMACESNLRKNSWLKNGCNAFDSKRPLSNPMSFWTEQDVLEYIIKYNVPYASVYGVIVRDDKGKLKTTKCDRTGCVYCCYGIHNEKEPNRIQRLQQTHPKLWEYCMRDWDNGGLGLKRILEYLGVKTYLE